MKKLLLLIVVVPFLVLACVSSDDSFLVQKLDDQGKSQALTAAGIDEYQLYVVKNKDFDQIPRIKEYFNTALRFDPTNAQAQQYLNLIDTYKAQQVKVNIAAANKILAKPKRTDDDTYQAVSCIRQVIALDPKNADAPRMLAAILRGRREARPELRGQGESVDRQRRYEEHCRRAREGLHRRLCQRGEGARHGPEKRGPPKVLPTRSGPSCPGWSPRA